MSIQTLSHLLAAIVTFVIGWSVLLRDRQQQSYIRLAVLAFNLFTWYLSHFLAEALHSPHMAWIAMVFATAIPMNAERFFRSFLADRSQPAQPLSRPVMAGTIVFGALLLIGLFYPIHHSNFLLFPLYLFIFGSLYYCVLLIRARQQALTSYPEATRLAYLFYGGAATVTLAAADFVPYLGIAFPTVGSVLTIIYMYFLSQTLFHYRLLDIKELLAKMVTLSALVLILTVIYGLLLVWVGSDRPGVFFFNTLVASCVILIIFEPLRSWLEGRFNRWIFAEKYEFSRGLNRLMSDLTNIIEVQPLVRALLGGLERSGRVTQASVYLADPSGTTYRLSGHFGSSPPEEVDARTRRLFFERLREPQPLSVEGLEHGLRKTLPVSEHEARDVTTRNILTTLSDLCADISIPLMADEEILGILNLRDDRLKEAYASDELQVLKQVADQAAITLNNSKVYEQLRERERLAALGQMAAGLAHEIRNPLSAIKGAAELLRSDLGATAAPQLLAHAIDTADSPSDFLSIIEEEVQRLDHVVSQFLGYARPDRGQHEALNINEIMHRTVELLRSGNDTVVVESDLAADLPRVSADPNQMQQVFLNLALNGLQAMSEQGTLTITTRGHSFSPLEYHHIKQNERRGDDIIPIRQSVEIAFRDTGRGIHPDILPSIFVPFFTTRDGGTGLGLPICQRIVENHGGSIRVHSTPGQGALFSVLLPALDPDDTNA